MMAKLPGIVNVNLQMSDETKARKEAAGMTWDGLLMLGLDTAEKAKAAREAQSPEKTA
jgi:hypothetical protein